MTSSNVLLSCQFLQDSLAKLLLIVEDVAIPSRHSLFLAYPDFFGNLKWQDDTSEELSCKKRSHGVVFYGSVASPMNQSLTYVNYSPVSL